MSQDSLLLRKATIEIKNLNIKLGQLQSYIDELEWKNKILEKKIICLKRKKVNNHVKKNKKLA